MKTEGIKMNRTTHKGRKRRGFALFAAFCIILSTVSACGADQASAIAMRLQRLVGTVHLYDAKGKETSFQEQMRLLSGQSITTALESLVMVSLDDTKLVTLEENTKANIESSGKKLKLNVTEGNFFFNVTEKIAEGETFEIQTSNMICGIRGTSAYNGLDADGHEILMVTDGVIDVEATNPTTGEKVTTNAEPGNMITIFLDEEASTGTISFTARKFTEEMLPASALNTISLNPQLGERIEKATGLSQQKMETLAVLSSTPTGIRPG